MRKKSFGISALVVVVVLGVAAVLATGWGEDDEVAWSQRGQASWYGPGFHGEETASGAIFDQGELTAAHKKLPFGTEVTVTNEENGKVVEVEITDRGPYAAGRVIDLSKAAAEKIGMREQGTVPVRIEASPQQLEAGRSGDPGHDL